MSQSAPPDRAADEAAIRGLLDLLQRSVAARDFEAVRAMIPDDATNFGSYEHRMIGYEDIRRNQYERVWPNITEFTLDPATLQIGVSGDLAWAACLFSSYTTDADGQRVPRLGRMTFIYERRGGRWLQVHTHASLTPGHRLLA